MSTRAVNVLLRASVALAFIYVAISAHLRPEAWLGYFPSMVLDSGLSENVILWGFSIMHIVIGVWIMIGKRIFIPSIIATIYLTGVVVTNLSQLDVVFRDISIALVALALAMKPRR